MKLQQYSERGTRYCTKCEGQNDSRKWGQLQEQTTSTTDGQPADSTSSTQDQKGRSEDEQSATKNPLDGSIITYILSP